jgi:hypothetical protein
VTRLELDRFKYYRYERVKFEKDVIELLVRDKSMTDGMLLLLKLIKLLLSK